MKSYLLTTTEVSEAASYITEGRIVAVPTGTSYALCVDALQGWALQRLRNLKNRPVDKTFTIFMKKSLWSRHLNISPQEAQVLSAMDNRPLTLLVRPKISLKHLAKDGLVGLRVIDHPIMSGLADSVDVPLTATSANRSGAEPFFSPRDILREFPGKIDETTYDLSLAVILDGGDLPKKKPTTLATLVDGQVVIIRQGEITAQDIAEVLSKDS